MAKATSKGGSCKVAVEKNGQMSYGGKVPTMPGGKNITTKGGKKK